MGLRMWRKQNQITGQFIGRQVQLNVQFMKDWLVIRKLIIFHAVFILHEKILCTGLFLKCVKYMATNTLDSFQRPTFYQTSSFTWKMKWEKMRQSCGYVNLMQAVKEEASLSPTRCQRFLKKLATNTFVLNTLIILWLSTGLNLI